MKRIAVALLLLLASPAWADAPARPSREQTLDRLLGMLKVAPDEQSATSVEASIKGQWMAEATPAAKLLLQHGFAQLGEHQASEAFDDFDAALDLQPNLQEGWHGRALARADLGDYAGAIRDIAEVMKREPRQFSALVSLSSIFERRQDWRGAYEAWRRVLDLDPKTQGGEDRLKDLKRRAFGEQT